MASYNRVILMGNLTRDVELKYIQSGTAVAEIGLAVNERRKLASGEWGDVPVFVDVTLWERTAEVASEYLSKGSSVLIEGRLRLDTWETDGQKRSKLRVTADRMQMVGSRGGGGSGGGGGGSGSGSGSSRPQRDESEYSQPAHYNDDSGGGDGGEEIPF